MEFDYIKSDSCNAPSSVDVGMQQYHLFAEALRNTTRGDDVFFNLCGWHAQYAAVGRAIGAQSWRIGPDDINWHGVLTNIDINSRLGRFAGPGAYNDPCLLLGEDISGKQHVTNL